MLDLEVVQALGGTFFSGIEGIKQTFNNMEGIFPILKGYGLYDCT